MIVITPATTHTARSRPAQADRARDVCAHDENAGADHRAHHDHGGVEQAQVAAEAAALFSVLLVHGYGWYTAPRPVVKLFSWQPGGYE